jgi:integrase
MGQGSPSWDWYQGGEYVITDQAGTPVHPEWYSDEFRRLLRRAGLRRITLHDSRHTTLTLMEHVGVPISIISKWAGHTTRRSPRRPTSMHSVLYCAPH